MDKAFYAAQLLDLVIVQACIVTWNAMNHENSIHVFGLAKYIVYGSNKASTLDCRIWKEKIFKKM